MKKLATPLIAIALVCLAAPAAWAQSNEHFVVKAEDLNWQDMAVLPGAKFALIEGVLTEAVPFTFRVKFPANFDIPAHWHPAVERVTVLSGTFNVGEGDKLDRSKTRSLSAGSFSFIAAKHNHFGWTSEEAVIQLNGVGPWGITFVNPADDPRKK